MVKPSLNLQIQNILYKKYILFLQILQCYFKIRISKSGYDWGKNKSDVSTWEESVFIYRCYENFDFLVQHGMND